MTNEDFRMRKIMFAEKGTACLQKDCRANVNGDCQCLICSDFGDKPCPFYRKRNKLCMNISK